MNFGAYFEHSPLLLMDIGEVGANVTHVVNGHSRVSDLRICSLDDVSYEGILRELDKSVKDYDEYSLNMIGFSLHGVNYAIFADNRLCGMFGVTVMDSSLVVTNYWTIDKPPYENLLSGLMVFLHILSLKYKDINMLLPVRFNTYISFCGGDVEDISDILEDVFSSSPNVVYQKNDDKDYKTVFVPCGDVDGKDSVSLLSTGLDFCRSYFDIVFKD